VKRLFSVAVLVSCMVSDITKAGVSITDFV